MKKYIVPALTGFVGFWFMGPIGALVGIAIWWCINEINLMKK